MIGQRFTMDELGDAFGTEATDALAMGRLLEASADRVGMALPGVTTGFDVATEASGELGARVMAALANEPAPATTGFLLPLRRDGFVRGIVTSVRQAWVGLGGAGRPALARAAALAYVLAIAVAGISATGAATAGVLGLVGPAPTSSPVPTGPVPTLAPPPTQQAPTIIVPPSIAPTPSLTPSPSPSPSETPEESDDHGGNSGPGGGDDNSGPGGGDDSSGPGSDDDRATPESSDDHSGPGGDDHASPESSGDSSGPGSGDD